MKWLEASDPNGACSAPLKAIRQSKADVGDYRRWPCEYTSHGQMRRNTRRATWRTIRASSGWLAAAVSHARAGADIGAQSDRWWPRRRYGRNLTRTDLRMWRFLSYDAKYCSGFYGTFARRRSRPPQLGDRAAIRWITANAREALRDGALDLEEART